MFHRQPAVIWKKKYFSVSSQWLHLTVFWLLFTWNLSAVDEQKESYNLGLVYIHSLLFVAAAIVLGYAALHLHSRWTRKDETEVLPVGFLLRYYATVFTLLSCVTLFGFFSIVPKRLPPDVLFTFRSLFLYAAIYEVTVLMALLEWQIRFEAKETVWNFNSKGFVSDFV